MEPFLIQKDLKYFYISYYMSLFVKAFYGRSNLGDDAIFGRILQWADEFDVDLVVAAEDKREQLKEFCSAHPSVNVKFVQDSFFSWLKALFFARALMLGGGGLFPSDAPRHMISKFLIVLFARAVGRPVYMIGLGVNPVFNPISRFMWRIMTSLSAHISVRDKASYNNVAACLIPKQFDKLSECSDVVLSLDLSVINKGFSTGDNSHLPPERTTKYCLFSIARPWEEDEIEIQARRMDAFISSIESMLRLVIQRGYAPVMVPFYLPNDLDIAKKITSRFPPGVVIIEYSTSAFTRLSWFSRVEFAVTMRFHSLVFASINAKPAFSIAYDHKLESLADMMGTKEFTTRFGVRGDEFFGSEFDIDTQASLLKLGFFLDNLPSIQEQVSERLSAAKARSDSNFLRICKYFSS